MGFFRLLLILLLIYFILRYLSRYRSLHQSYKDTDKKILQDKIVPCPNCGTYNPTKAAFLKDGKYYCNEECFKGKQS